MAAAAQEVAQNGRAWQTFGERYLRLADASSVVPLFGVSSVLIGSVLAGRVEADDSCFVGVTGSTIQI